MVRAFIGLGSNLQDPLLQVKKALASLTALPQTRVIRHSSLYRSAPVGYDNQPDFINAVAEIETQLPAHTLLKQLLSLEAAQGRERPFPNAPRILDLDLLLYNAKVMNDPELTLPHPRMHMRGFVLLPLAEIAPDIEIPGHGKAAELAGQYANEGTERIED